MRKLIFALLLAAPAFAQQVCTLHQDVNVTPATGNTLIVNVPTDLGRNLTICAINIAVTQGTTPANYQLRGCTNTTCANPQALTPLFTGVASYYQTYTLSAANVLLPVLRGNGVYLYTSSAPTAAQVQVFYMAP